MLPRFADLVPTSAIEHIIFDIDLAFFRIYSFRFFVLVNVVISFSVADSSGRSHSSAGELAQENGMVAELARASSAI